LLEAEPEPSFRVSDAEPPIYETSAIDFGAIGCVARIIPPLSTFL